MFKIIYLLVLVIAAIYCDEGPKHTTQGTPIDVIKECSKLIVSDVKSSKIDPLIQKYMDDPNTLIQAIDSVLAEPKLKDKLEGTGEYYHACTNLGADKDNQKALRRFNKCSDRLTSYKSQVVQAIGFDAGHIQTAINKKLAEIADSSKRGNARVESYNKCINELPK